MTSKQPRSAGKQNKANPAARQKAPKKGQAKQSTAADTQLVEKPARLPLDKKDAEYLFHYANNILYPAGRDFLERLEKNEVELHHAYSCTFLLAHAMDHIAHCWAKILGEPKPSKVRGSVMAWLDDTYGSEGSEHIKRKFELLDAVNNALKHVELLPDRYKELIQVYGQISSSSLQIRDGRIMFIGKNYAFDFGRVVLRKLIDVFAVQINELDDVEAFVNCEEPVILMDSGPYGAYGEDVLPSDILIHELSKPCDDCGEGHENCRCELDNFAGTKGEFNPEQTNWSLVNEALEQVSGTREARRRDCDR
ncbi:hypothetical protein ACYPKM_00600 [Pseudomonas aeruginosa]